VLHPGRRENLNVIQELSRAGESLYLDSVTLAIGTAQSRSSCWTARTWSTLTVADANQKLGSTGSGPLDLKLQASIESGHGLVIRYDGNDLTTIASEDLENGRGQVEVLIDKGVAEVFVDGGTRYITREIPLSNGGHGLELSVKQKGASSITWKSTK
jgi:hypothetical protein